jgi:plasmid stabilization system protein ParE
MPNHAFEYHPEAIIEAHRAFHWYDERSKNAAEGFWKELRRARQLVSDQPESWMPYLHGTRCFKFDKYPYALVYIERGTRVIGIAVAHLKRRPGYWRKRLKDYRLP